MTRPRINPDRILLPDHDWCVVRIYGDEFLSDRRIAIRLALCEDVTARSGVRWLGRDFNTMPPIPDMEPGPSRATISGQYLIACADAGIDIRDQPYADGEPTAQHLYRDGEHVGWLMPVRDGHVTVDDLAALREVINGGCGVPDFPGFALGDVAAALLAWERRRTTRREASA